MPWAVHGPGPACVYPGLWMPHSVSSGLGARPPVSMPGPPQPAWGPWLRPVPWCWAVAPTAEVPVGVPAQRRGSQRLSSGCFQQRWETPVTAQMPAGPLGSVPRAINLPRSQPPGTAGVWAAWGSPAETAPCSRVAQAWPCPGRLSPHLPRADSRSQTGQGLLGSLSFVCAQVCPPFLSRAEDANPVLPRAHVPRSAQPGCLSRCPRDNPGD